MPTLLTRVALALALLSTTAWSQHAPRILFIRGGSGTGGFLEGGADEQLSDIVDLSTANGNHGWGQLNLLLRAEGYQTAQVVEGPVTDNTPVDLDALDLDAVDVIVFGSNNADYDPADAELIASWVCAGGAALFISDANWGTDWGDAPTSDQRFLDAFDLRMNQDKGTYALQASSGDFMAPGHPILVGPDGLTGTADDVTAFDGEGVSPITVLDGLAGVDPVIVARAKSQKKLNDSPGSGTTVATGPDDGSLIALEYGLGRVACHFDRNTFFNENGAGTSLVRFDNTQYAKNLFRWLVDAGGPYGSGCPTAGGLVPALAVSGQPEPGNPLQLSLTDGPGGAPVALLLGLGQDLGQKLGSCPLLISSVWETPIVFALPGTGPTGGSVDLPVTLPPSMPLGLYTVQAFLPGSGPGGLMASTNAVALFVH